MRAIIRERTAGDMTSAISGRKQLGRSHLRPGKGKNAGDHGLHNSLEDGHGNDVAELPVGLDIGDLDLPVVRETHEARALPGGEPAGVLGLSARDEDL